MPQAESSNVEKPYLTPAKRTLPRRPPANVRALNESHARQIGEISIAWNSLHVGFYEIFMALMPTADAAFGIWHTIQSDKGQRDMMLQAARGIMKDRKKLLANLEWVAEKATMLSTFRNDAMHAAMNFRSGAYSADPLSTRKQALQRLAIVPIDKSWKNVRGDLYALTSYANFIWAEVFDPGCLRFWPYRPRILTKPTKVPVTEVRRNRKVKQRAKPITPKSQ